MTGPGRTRRGRGNEAGGRGFATPESGGQGLPTSGLRRHDRLYLGLMELAKGGRSLQPHQAETYRRDERNATQQLKATRRLRTSLNIKGQVKPDNQWSNCPVPGPSKDLLVVIMVVVGPEMGGESGGGDV